MGGARRAGLREALARPKRDCSASFERAKLAFGRPFGLHLQFREEFQFALGARWVPVGCSLRQRCEQGGPIGAQVAAKFARR